MYKLLASYIEIIATQLYTYSLAAATAAANEISIKSPKATAAETLIKSSNTFLQPENYISEDNENNKENNGFGTYNVRSKLQRLGKLYSGKQQFYTKMK